MICSSEKRFFTSNLLVDGDWTPDRRATQKRGDVEGTETFVHARSGSTSTALTRLVQQFTLAVTQHQDRGVKRAEFGVVSPAQHHAETAACLVEVSFMDVAQEEERLAQDAYQQGVAEGLAAALHAYSFVR